MSTRKTPEQRLEELEQKEARLKAQKKKIKHQISQRERNKRTKRLIELGATIEKAAGMEITADMLPAVARFISDQERRGNYFTNTLRPTQTTLDSSLNDFQTRNV